MTKKDIEFAVIHNTVSILAVMCGASKDKVVDLLTGYLWDEEEASGIKESDGKYKFGKRDELLSGTKNENQSHRKG